jgi:hypothetical protein
VTDLPSGAAIPDWYPLLQAAKYLEVPPWILYEQPLIWQLWAQQAMHAESDAKRQLNGG